MGALVRAWLDLDTALRAFDRSGDSARARSLRAALCAFRRQSAALVLTDHGGAAKTDFAIIVQIASAAGLSWQDMAEAVNNAAEHRPRNSS
jgi:hypothetical protein